MKLNNFVKVLAPYRGKSKYGFWESLKPGYGIEISMVLAPPGYGRSLYATTINFRSFSESDPMVDGSFHCSLTEACNYLSKLDYEDISL